MTAHRSYSQLTSWTSCGKQYELTRIHHAPERPSWWLIGGKAFHAAIEFLNYAGELPDPDDDGIVDFYQDLWEFFWDREMTAAEDPLYPVDMYRAGGKMTKDKPNKEDGAWWCSVGPQMLLDYSAWLLDMEKQGWRIAVLPDGTMGIETEFNVTFGDVPVKMFADLILRKGDDWLIVDAKTGQKPQATGQLGLYACGMEMAYGIRPGWGGYYMARSGELTPPVDLSRFTVGMFGKQFADLDRGIRAEIFLPKVSGMCNSCGVNRFCAAYGGDQADLYDPLAQLTKVGM